MSIHRVAVASTDGKVINEHFGRASRFLVFEINGTETFKFIETRETYPVCRPEGHHQQGLELATQLLQDCRAVLVSQIGPGAAATLQQRGIRPIVRPDFIDTALAEYALMAANNQIQNK